MNQINNKTETDIVIPVSLGTDTENVRKASDTILDLHRKYGYRRFMLACPSKGWRAIGFPPKEHFEELARAFLDVKNALLPYGIECGWWITTVIKSGPSDDFVRIKRANGTLAPFSSCPLDKTFREHFADCVALFARIAKPSFIITEDDYSIIASAPGNGCFCDLHLDKFSKRMGKEYTREELSAVLSERTPSALEIIKKWRELMKDTLVDFAREIRKKLDEVSPEIPVGYMQAGCADAEGDCTYEICKALAGDKHIPFSRLYGTFYNGVTAQNIPTVTFHPIYCRQHIEGDFKFYHESDSFPTSRFFTSGTEMRAIMATVYSAGFGGSTFQQLESSDLPEETAYGKMFIREKKRFDGIIRKASECEMLGVEICYDPFYNTLEAPHLPSWIQPIALFGIPYTTKESKAAFWDKKQARYCDDSTVKKYLSKVLFLDGEAARILCNRGYSEYIGVSAGDDITVGKLAFDLAAEEIVREEFASDRYARTMGIASVFASGKEASAVRLTPNNASTRIITEVVSSAHEIVSPGMTLYKNELGGTVIVMGMTIGESYSQSLLCYTRQRLFEKLISENCDEYVFVKNTPRIFTVMNQAKNADESGFIAMLTLINLGCDTQNGILLHLPKKLEKAESILALTSDGEWKDVCFRRADDGVMIDVDLNYLDPMYLIFK